MLRPAETAAHTALPAFFEDAAREHAATVASVGGCDFDLRFADRLIRLRFAGTELADALLSPFRPRRADFDALGAETEEPLASPSATIALWQEREVPGHALPIPWRESDLAARGLLRGPDGSDVMAVHELGYHATTLIDRRARLLAHRVPDCAALPWWERAAPLRPALFWALSGADRHLVHAGAVGDERGGVLLAGAGGSGKTTVALAALAGGMKYVSDDYLLLHTHAEPVAWNLFATAKLDAGHLARFPRLAPTANISPDPVPDEKWVLDVTDLFPGALAPALPIRAIVVPRIRGGHSALQSASAGVALLALAPSTAFQMPYDDGAVVASLAALVRSVPAFVLDVGDDVGELPVAIDRVLDTVAADGVAVDTERVVL
ncbi:MAG: hypothetical protein WB709_06780 [Solirubrobacteraceae bacterium]